jgi:rare lipoprotein A
MIGMLRAALCATLALVAVGTTAARADWRDGFTDQSKFRNAPWTRDEAVPATRNSRATATTGKPTRQAAAKGKRGLVQKASLTSQSGWSNSFGGGTQSGIASYYWQPQRVASGGWFNPNAMTAAHRTLPFGTKVQVTNMTNGRAVTVTINDRGPFIAGRVIDLSAGAAGVIGMKGQGLARVSLTVLGR